MISLASPKTHHRTVFTTILGLVIVILVFGLWYFRRDRIQTQHEVKHAFSVVSKLRQIALNQWCHFVLEEAGHIANHSILRGSFSVGPSGLRLENAEMLEEIFSSFLLHYDYEDILLVHSGGRVFFSVQDEPHPLVEAEQFAIVESAISKGPRLTHFHLDPKTREPVVSVVCRVPDAVVELPSEEGLIFAILRIDPKTSLYPLIDSWPVDAATSKTILAQWDGHHVVPVNRLPFLDVEPLGMQIPITDRNASLVMAAEGKKGVFEATDYRGVQVLAALNQLPGTPWFMSCEIDLAEAYQRLYAQGNWILGMTASLVIGLVVLVALLWQWSLKAGFERMYQSEARLRAGETRFSVILKAVEDGIIAVDAHGSVSMLNPKAEALTGWSDVEARGRRFEEVFQLSSDAAPEETNPIPSVLARGSTIQGAAGVELTSRSGGRCAILYSCAPIREGGAGITGAVLVFRDQTQELRAQRELNDTLQRLNEAQQVAHVGSWDYLPEAKKTWWSDEVYRIFELDPAVFVPTYPDFLQWVHPDDRDMIDAEFQESLRSPRRRVLTHRVLLPDGRVKIVQENFFTEFDENHEPVRTFGTIHDITEHEQAKEAARESEERYRLLAAYSRDIILQVDLDQGRIIEANPAAVAAYGYSREELLTKTIFDLRPDTDPQRIYAQIREGVDYGHLLELVHFRKDGTTFPVEASVQGVTLDHQNLLVSVIRDISDRKQVEAELAESRRQMDALMGNLPGMAYRCKNNASWTMEFVSQGCYQLTGYTDRQLVGNAELSYSDLIVPEDRVRVWAEIQAAVHQGGQFSIFYSIKTAQGQIRQVWEQGIGVYDSSGEVLALEGFINDVTLLKEAEDRLRSAHQQLADANALLEHRVQERTRDLVAAQTKLIEILESMNDVFYSLDDDWRFVMVNPKAEQYFLRSKGELIGKSIWAVVPASIGSEFESVVRSAKKRRRPTVLEHPSYVQPGQTLEFHIYPGANGISVLCSNISERKRAEEQIQRLSRIVEQSPVGVMITDRDGVITYVNQAFSEMSGHATEEIVGQKPRVLRSGIHPPELYQSMWDTLVKGQTWFGELCNHRKNGELYWEAISIVPIRNAKGVVTDYAAQMLDISYIKEVERQLRQAKMDADAASRAKSRFLANMSHEIRTPLNAILGYTQLLHRETGLTPQQYQHLETINRSGEHLLGLINDILEISKIEAGRAVNTPESFNVRTLVEDIALMFRLQAERAGLELSCDISDSMPEQVVADTGKLRQILVNLVGNALKFTERGSIKLAVHCRSLEDRNVFLVFEVTDTGVGIDEQELSKLFVSFEQTESGRRKQGGTGLGLAISQEYVHLMGGEISVTSRVGVGTTFRFEIPALLSSAAQAATEGLPDKADRLAMGLTPLHAFIMDEDLDQSRLTRSFLEQLGFQVRCAESVSALIPLSQDSPPRLILFDWEGLKEEAPASIHAIRSLPQGEDIKIFALVAFASEEAVREMGRLGVTDCLIKPLRTDQLWAKIQQHLGECFASASPPTEGGGRGWGPEVLDSLSSAQRLALMDAVQTGFATRIRQLAEEISQVDPIAGQFVLYHADRYDYERLLNALQSNSDPHDGVGSE
jgi:PAS domain S-box-containing protein